MLQIVKSKSCIKAVVTIVSLAFATAGFASGLHPARIMPTGKVFVYQEGNKVSELSAEAPLPEGYLLLCDGKAGLKMDGLYWVAADKSLFSVTTKADSLEFELQEGTAYFALSELPQPLVFITPHGVFTAQEATLNASTDEGLLKGYVAVTSEGTDIGVIEGGSLLISGSEGEKRVQAGNRIRVANNVAAGDGDASAASATKKSGANPGNAKGKKFMYGAIAVGGIAGVALLAGGGSSSSSRKSKKSPSSP